MRDFGKTPGQAIVSKFPRWRNAYDSPFAIVLVAFALRVAFIIAARTYRFNPDQDHFAFGYELGRIGRSLVHGQGFSNPFHGITGPTAWEAPLYPVLIGGVFRLFGIYTPASAFVLLSLNSLFAAFTSLPIFSIARRCFGQKVALWSSWTWALAPWAIFWPTHWIWETSLAAFLLALLLSLTLDLEARDGASLWVMFGLVWGIAALTNATLLSLLPVFGLWAWYGRAKRGKRSLPGVLAAAAIFLACLAPWTVRNYRTFNRFILIRSNFGAELRLGNGPGANGLWMDFLEPTQSVEQLERYRQMGEVAYVALRKQEALAFIREDYARFAWLSFRRFTYFWKGLPRSRKSASELLATLLYFGSSLLAGFGLAQALRKHSPGAWLFFWVMLTYPFVYYVVFFRSRYRHPIEPELAILMLYAVFEAVSRSRPGGAAKGAAESNDQGRFLVTTA